MDHLNKKKNFFEGKLVSYIALKLSLTEKGREASSVGMGIGFGVGRRFIVLNNIFPMDILLKIFLVDFSLENQSLLSE